VEGREVGTLLRLERTAAAALAGLAQQQRVGGVEAAAVPAGLYSSGGFV
jgi:hypothetical protein